MLDLWSQRAALRSVADQAHDAARRGEARWLKTIPGGGRHTLLHLLGRRDDVIGIELAGAHHLDAPFHFLAQLARAVGEPLAAAAATSGDVAELEALRARAQALGGAARGAGQVLALLLPFDWPTAPAWSDVGEATLDAGERARLRRLRAVVQGAHDSGATAIVISTARAAHPWRAATSVAVTRPVVGAAELTADRAPALAAAVAAAARALREAGCQTTPIEARALVGLAALGASPQRVVQEPPRHWIPRFALQVAEHPSLARGARVLAHARRPLRRERLAPLLGAAGLEWELLTECVAYGDQEVRVAEPLQLALQDHLAPADDDDDGAHALLAGYHRTLDGQPSPAALGLAETVHWLEKLHHLAHGGERTEREWGEQAKLDREQYWARARHLSRRARRYGDAAELYRQCRERFGPDSYTEHYLGFNLDRDRAAPALVRPHYEKAVELDPANPWWNTRLVTFLIGHGTLAEARRAWAAALTALDPDGARMEESPWLALHLHRWVARRWLALGHVAEARGVLDAIPRQWLEREDELGAVEHLIRDAEESLRLGESVYPAGVPAARRWRGPRVTPAVNASGARRARWWPGRVLGIEAGEVAVVLAEPAPDPEARAAYRVAYAADQWRAMANQAPSDARGFIELAEYADGSLQVRVVPDEPAASLADDLRDVVERIGA